MRTQALAITFLLASLPAQDAPEIRVAPLPPVGPAARGAFHRAPLAPGTLAKLPAGTIAPKGWLEFTLANMGRGMFGRLPEVSRYCRPDGNAWLSPKGEGELGWEEAPYWLRGFVSLALATGDQGLRAAAQKWVDAVLASQREDGWFGPESNKKQHDLWPNMLVCRALITWHEATQDPRILPFLQKYLRWQTRVPEEHFLPGSWQKLRGADNLLVVHWLYDRTGEAWLLELAERTHRRTSDWLGSIPSWHGVNLCQGFREPALWSLQSKESAHVARSEAIYQEVYAKYGQTPGGMFGADENCRVGRADARQGVETCSMVEMMYSQQLLVGITGDVKHADRCEDVAWNSLPAAVAGDQKALHYLTAPNLISCDAGDKHPGFENRGCMLAFSADERYRCCQHNAVFGWPYYLEHLWMATGDGGLASVLHGPSVVEAEVVGGERVRVECRTQYPFLESLEYLVRPTKEVRFPLWLRVPGWAPTATIRVNGGEARTFATTFGAWIVVDRTWKPGDKLVLELEARVHVKRWPEQKGAATVQRGPLTYALPIRMRSKRIGGSDAWPDYELHPVGEWRYALDLEAGEPVAPPLEKSTRLLTFDGTERTLVAKFRSLPEWGTSHGLVGALQPSPVRASGDVVELQLVPMGSAMLRIAMFPVAGKGEDARAWRPEPVPPRTSHSHDDPLALDDGILPASSDDHAVPRFTWWDHKGTEEWVQYEYATPRRISSAAVYWFDDAPRGGHCRVPASWSLRVLVGDTWREVEGASEYGTAKDRLHEVKFTPVTASAVRLVVKLQPGWSGGAFEFAVRE